MPQELPLHGHNATVFAYWKAKRDGRVVPPMAAIDLLDFEPRVIEWLQVLDRVSADELRVRFFGPGYVSLTGRETTGTNPYNFYSGRRRELVVAYMNRLFAEPGIGLSLDKRTTPRGAKFAFEFLHLPLADEAGRVLSLLTSGVIISGRLAQLDPGGDHSRASWQRASIFALPGFTEVDFIAPGIPAKTQAGA